MKEITLYFDIKTFYKLLFYMKSHFNYIL